MGTLRFSVANFITINVMVAIMFAAFGLGKSVLAGSGTTAGN
jgi:hypothetical protein